MTVTSWYFGSWDSVYFDVLYLDSDLQRFKLIIKPDLSDASLHLINIPVTIPDDLTDSLAIYNLTEGYSICDDTLVYFWDNRKMWGIYYAGLMSAPFTDVVARWDGHIDSICPTSGRFVYGIDSDDGDGTFIDTRIVVVDLF